MLPPPVDSQNSMGRLEGKDEKSETAWTNVTVHRSADNWLIANATQHRPSRANEFTACDTRITHRASLYDPEYETLCFTGMRLSLLANSAWHAGD
jgi:hypothetical protein